MRYGLRTLLILMAILPPILAPLGVWGWREYVAWRSMRSGTAPGDGYLGAEIDDFGQGEGVLVLRLRPGAPAETGGLRTGDIITSINNRPCRHLDDFDGAFFQLTPGGTLPMDVRRGGTSKSLTVTLGKRPGRL